MSEPEPERLDDDRTPEQRRADAKLASAMEMVIAAYSIAPAGSMFLSNFIVVGNGYVNNANGEHKIYFKVLKDGGISLNWDECQGMLQRASKELYRDFFEDGQIF